MEQICLIRGHFSFFLFFWSSVVIEIHGLIKTQFKKDELLKHQELGASTDPHPI